MSQSRDRLRRGRRTGCILLVTLLAAACTRQTEPLEIPFALRLGDAAPDCDGAVAGVRLTDLRLFVHDFRLLDRNGDEVPVELVERPPWQGESVALLDFETGAGPCRNGSREVNTSVHGVVAPGEYSGLRFRIGVPAALNHLDPLQAAPPLNLSSMHWHWQTGYKFLRAGVIDDDDGFWIHLGSTRCEGTASEPAGCRNANVPEVSLPGFTPGTGVVMLDLAPLLGTVDLDDGEATDCSSGPAESSCHEAFRALGLDFESGKSSGTPAVVRTTTIE